MLHDNNIQPTPRHGWLSRAALVPENLWHLRAFIFVAMLTAFGLELVARSMRSTPIWEGNIPETISLFALLLLCGSALFLIFLLEGHHVLKTMVSFAAFVLVFAQLLALARDTFASPAFHAWSKPIEGPLFLAGVILLLTTFYYALLETVSVKALLRREQGELYSEIAKRVQIQSELEISRDQLRQLTGHVESVREQERARIAREIHDELGQTLTSLKIDLASLSDQLAARPDLASTALETIESMKQQINTTVIATRRIMSELHPVILDDLGLEAALEWLSADFQSRNNIPCVIRIENAERVTAPAHKSAIFRIVQECLTNIMRHANATQAEITIEVTPLHVNLSVVDNGCGIQNGALNGRSKSFGLLGMRERVTLLNGQFTVQSMPNEGTRIAVVLPLTGEGKPEFA